MGDGCQAELGPRGVGLRIHLEFAFVWMMMAMVSGLALLMAVFLLYLVLRGGL